MEERLERTEMLLGKSMEQLKNASVIVFGIGGVGGYTAEALARSGIGKIALVDADVVSESNINRQIIALSSTVGRKKTEVMKERIFEINPNCEVTTFDLFYLPENADQIDLAAFDFVVDAIDTVSAKIELAVRATALNVPIISCMGTGNKLDPSKLCVTDLAKTSVCPLARVMRRELRARGITHLKVVYSTEEAKKDEAYVGERTPGSVAFVPSVAGLMIAWEVVREIAFEK